MDAAMLVNKRVLIKSIGELGTVVSHHRDDRDDPVIVVVRDSDGEHHCCRVIEIEVQLNSDEIDDLVSVVGE